DGRHDGRCEGDADSEEPNDEPPGRGELPEEPVQHLHRDEGEPVPNPEALRVVERPTPPALPGEAVSDLEPVADHGEREPRQPQREVENREIREDGPPRTVALPVPERGRGPAQEEREDCDPEARAPEDAETQAGREQLPRESLSFRVES